LDKVILITGASGGLGAATARELERRGARLALMARSADRLDAVCGPGALRIQGDVTVEADRQRAIDAAVERFGRLDVLINNAGAGAYGYTPSLPPEAVRDVIGLNLHALIRMTQLAVPHLKRTRGSLVNVGSIAGYLPLPWFTVYTATKFAVLGFTEASRIELKPDGIHVMLVSPGYVKTGFQDNALGGRPPDRIWRMKTFATEPAAVARAIARGIERRTKRIVIPRLGALALWRNLLPGPVDAILESLYKGYRTPS
jgi:short-subunit dehydrogenase